MTSKELQILDTTLRDGSYIIDFQFTAEDTALIVSCLAHAGIPLIEVAHGLGLGAAKAGKGLQASTDEAYLNAAVQSAGKSQVGAFFIPGIGTEDDIRLAADCGTHFIRIGTNVNEVDQSESFIKLAKSLGLTVFSNLMKSYAVPPQEFAGYVKQTEEYGTDYLCIVDSAGGMLPEDVRNYMEAAQSAAQLPVCFHGHNNLSMAVANSLQAVESGAVIVDASLQGMGRSEGNTITEVLISILQKRGLMLDIDVHALLDVSEAFIRPLLKTSGYSGLGIVSGKAKFHSSFLNLVLEVARTHHIDPRDLILKVTEHDQVNASRETVENAALVLAQAPPRTQIRFNLATPNPSNDTDLITAALHRAKELKEKSHKQSLPSVLNIVVSPYEDTHVSPYVETAFGCALSNIMLDNPERLDELLQSVDGIVDYVLLDPGIPYVMPEMTHTTPLLYSDHAMWARAAVTHLTQLLGGSVTDQKISVLGVDALTGPALHLLDFAKASTQDISLQHAQAILALSPRKPIIGIDEMSHIPHTALVYDGGMGSISEGAMSIAAQRQQRVVRIDMRPTLAATALELIHTRQLVHESMGRDTWNGIGVVAGGLIGAKGEVIVDHISRPTRVIGVADGKGGIMPLDQSNGSILLIQQAIAKRQLEASRGA